MSFPNGQGLPVQVYEDNTCTSAGSNPANNNNRFIIQPAAGFTNPLPEAILTGQENINTIQPAPVLFDRNAWLAQNTTPGAPTTVAGLTP
ncbi:hypothetical protein IWW34DRAFT_825020 [Fusarium oxysporum f. sp. albedinis]|nr:hypothetical protein IWW34DRAFT_825020 [Fusarium oxysporum f. sp. albedinis]